MPYIHKCMQVRPVNVYSHLRYCTFIITHVHLASHRIFEHFFWHLAFGILGIWRVKIKKKKRCTHFYNSFFYLISSWSAHKNNTPSTSSKIPERALKSDKSEVCGPLRLHFEIIFLGKARLRARGHHIVSAGHGGRLEKPRMDVTPLFPPRLRTLMTCNVRPRDL